MLIEWLQMTVDLLIKLRGHRMTFRITAFSFKMIKSCIELHNIEENYTNLKMTTKNTLSIPPNKYGSPSSVSVDETTDNVKALNHKKCYWNQ